MNLIRKGWIVIICLSFFVLQFKMVMSGSMEPLIPTGSLAIITYNHQSIQTGDIILYDLNSMQVIHRVIEVNGDSYITKGDANNTADLNPVSSTQVKGKYLFSIPYLGYIVFYLKRYFYFVLIILFIIWRNKDEFKTNYD